MRQAALSIRSCNKWDTLISFHYKHGAQTEYDLGILVVKYKTSVEQFRNLSEWILTI